MSDWQSIMQQSSAAVRDTAGQGAAGGCRTPHAAIIRIINTFYNHQSSHSHPLTNTQLSSSAAALRQSSIVTIQTIC